MKHSVHEIKLANGVQGLAIDVPDSRMVSLQISFRAGSHFCPPEKSQLAHFMEHIMCTANEKQNEKQFIAAISKNGAYTNAFTNPNDVSYLAYCAEFEWKRILDLFLLSVTKPKFLEEHFIREREVIRQELTNALTNYGLQLTLATNREINRFDYTTQKSLESLERIKLIDLKAFYRKTHYTQNMRFLIAGNLSSKIGEIERIMSGVKLPSSAQSRLEPFKSPLIKVNGAVTVQNPDVDKFYFDIAIIRPGKWSYEEWIAIDLLADCLFGYGGIGGLKARITGPARERGLLYSIGGGASDYHGNMSLACWGRVEPAKAKELFELITSEIEKLRQGKLTDREFKELKERAAGSDALREPTVSGLLNHYSTLFLKNGEILDYDIYFKLLPKITKKNALNVFGSILAKKKWYLSLLGAETDAYKDELYATVSSVLAK